MTEPNDSDRKILAVEDSAYLSKLSGCVTTTGKEAVDHKEPTHGYDDDNEPLNQQSHEVIDEFNTLSQEILVNSMTEPNCDDSGITLEQAIAAKDPNQEKCKNSKKKKKKKKKKGINHNNGSKLASCEFCNENIQIGSWTDLFCNIYRIGNLPCKECQQIYCEQEWFAGDWSYIWPLNPMIATDTKQADCDFCRDYHECSEPECISEDCGVYHIEMSNMADFFHWAIASGSHPCGTCKQFYHAQEWFCKEMQSLVTAVKEGYILHEKDPAF